MPMVCTQEHNKSISEVGFFAVDCSDSLESDETMTGTPTSSGQSEMTISSITVTAAERVIEGRTVAAGKALTFKASGGTTPGRYEVKFISATTITSARQIRGVVINLQAD